MTMRNLKLVEVRLLMEHGGIATNRDLSVARRRANPNDPFLANMIRALSLHYWQNTREEWQRLEAALMLREAKRKSARAR